MKDGDKKSPKNNISNPYGPDEKNSSNLRTDNIIKNPKVAKKSNNIKKSKVTKKSKNNVKKSNKKIKSIKKAKKSNKNLARNIKKGMAKL